MMGKEKNLQQEKFLMEYYHQSKDSIEEKKLSEIESYLKRSLNLADSQEDLLKEAGRLMHHISSCQEIAFGVREADENYRYQEMIGFRREAVEARNAITYSFGDLTDGVSFKSFKIGKFTHLHLSEFDPFKPGEEMTFNHPELLGGSRKYPDDMIEGDYLDVYIFGKKKEILGWIELSGSKTGKLPSREEMLLIEFFATCLSILLAPFQKDLKKSKRLNL